MSICAVSQAQFSLTETFANNNISSTIITGGNAQLTAAAGIDPAGQGWLRLTNSTGQSGYCYINKDIPSGLGVLAEFEFKSWSTSYDPNADGFSMFLFDANYGPGTFSIGAPGGALGYQGLSGAYVGIGLDEFGNNSNQWTASDVLAPGFTGQAITVRAPTSEGNIYLKGTGANLGGTPLAGTALSYGISTTGRPTDDVYFRKIRITVAPIGGLYQIIVALQTSASGTMTNILTTTTATPPPANLKIGFAGSTGSYWANHEIRNLTVTTPGGVRAEKTGPQLFKNGDDISYKIKVYNDGLTPQSGIAVTDSLPAGFQFGSVAFDNAGNAGNTFDVNTGAVNNNVYTNNSLSLQMGSYGIITINGKMTLTDSTTKQKKNTAIAKAATGVLDPDLINDTSRFTSYRVPVVNKKDVTICSNNQTNIALATMGDAHIAWTVSTTGSITGAAAGSGTADAYGSFTLNQLITNTGTTAGSVTYTVTPSYVHTLPGGSTITATGDPVMSTVTVNPMPAVPTLSWTAVCEGSDQLLKAVSSTPGASYKWSGAKLLIINDQAIIQAATVASNGIYGVAATLNGCVSAQATGNVQIKPMPAVPTASYNIGVCQNTDLLLSASTSTSGTISYNWTGPNSFTSNIAKPSIVKAGLSAAGHYGVSATLNGCTSASTDLNVAINAAPAPPVITGSLEACVGGTPIQLASHLSNTQNVTWFTQSGTLIGTAAPTVPTDKAGNIVYLAANNSAQQCQSDLVTLTASIKTNVSVTINENDVTCKGGTNGSIVLTVTTGLAPYTYKWNNGTNKQNAVNLPAGKYNAMITDANGCYVNTADIVVNDGVAPQPPVVNNLEVCEETGSATLTANGTNLQWYSSDGSSLSAAPRIDKSTPKFYSYYVSSKDALGCEGDKAVITALIKPRPAITAINKKEPNCNGYVKGTLDVSAAGGCNNGAYTFTLLNTMLTQSTGAFKNIEPGTYAVQVSDACGCSVTQSIDMNVKMIDCDLQLPNAFTPNNDNRNDIFRPTTWGNISDYRLQVFNRQGQLVFQSTRPENGWDGTIKGMEQPQGTYIWQLVYKNEKGELRNLKGTVVMLK